VAAQRTGRGFIEDVFLFFDWEQGAKFSVYNETGYEEELSIAHNKEYFDFDNDLSKH